MACGLRAGLGEGNRGRSETGRGFGCYGSRDAYSRPEPSSDAHAPPVFCMAPKKEKGGTVSNSSKLWEPSLIGAHFNQVSSEPRKSCLTPAVPKLRQSLQAALPGSPSLRDAPSPLPKTVLDPALPRRIAPSTKDPGSHQRRMGVEGRWKGTPGESVRFQSVEKAEWWGTEMV